MSLKSLFAELYSHRDDPPEAFKTLSAFKELCNKPDILSKIDPFNLPEVTKCVCYSSKMMEMPFAEKYKAIQPLYCSEKIDPASVFNEYQKADTLEDKILQYADLKILDAFDSFFLDMEKEKAEQDAQLKNDRAALQSKKKSEHPIDEEITELNKKIEEEKKTIKRLNQFLKKNKTIIDKIRIYKQRTAEADERRDKAYQRLADIDSQCETTNVMQQIVTSGIVRTDQEKQFRNQSFLRSFLFILSKEENKRNAVDILLKLYDVGAIDLNESPTFDFFVDNSSLLIDYLFGILPTTIEDTNSESLNVLVDLALKQEVERESDENKAVYSVLWNRFTEEFEWEWMIEKIARFYPDEFDRVAGKLMKGLTGKASAAYVNVLFGSDILGRKKSAAEIFSVLLSSSGFCGSDSIINALRLLEKDTRIIQRKLNNSERKQRCQAQDLFSSMYMPLEALEVLAIDLSVTVGQIDSSLVGSQLRNQLAELRGALETFDVKPLADIDDWKNLRDVTFDPDHHKLGTETNPPNKIMFKSMGFSYTDDEGVQKERAALVSKKMPRRGLLDAPQRSKKDEPKLKRERREADQKECNRKRRFGEKPQ